MAQPQKLDRFDAFIPREPFVNPWRRDGSYASDFELLSLLLREAVGTEQSSGIVAGATDVWAAEELRRAGFDADDVWPRRQSPRILPRDVREFVERGLTRSLRSQVEGRYNTQGARRALPAEARVMGSAYLKQGDVVVASWAAGVEVLISTKTMLSSYAKNLRNRFEEGYGDAKTFADAIHCPHSGSSSLPAPTFRTKNLTSRSTCFESSRQSPMSTTVAACCSSEWRTRPRSRSRVQQSDRSPPPNHLGSRTQRSSSCTTGRRRISRLVRSFGDSSPKRSPICR